MSLDERGLENAFGFAGIGRWELTVDTGALVLDAACRDLFEVSPEEAGSQATIAERVHPDHRDRAFGALEELTEDGDVYDTTFRLSLPSGQERWLRGVAKLTADRHGKKVVGVSFDVTSEQMLLADRELHLAEINHRIKNLFALVSAMISSASRESVDKDEVIQNLRGRIAALDRAHSLMLRTDVSQPISLGALLGQVLSPARSHQTIVMTGDEVLIPAKAITSLVLIVHEWVTNSAKYGALKTSEGTIKVDWKTCEDGVHIIWREKVPEYDPEAEKGFGSRLIQASAMQLRAEKTRSYEDGWLTINMKMPLEGS